MLHFKLNENIVARKVINPHKIRKNNRVCVPYSSVRETARVLYVNKGVARLDNSILGFYNWHVKFLARTKKVKKTLFFK